jgi:hypothetical protein
MSEMRYHRALIQQSMVILLVKKLFILHLFLRNLVTLTILNKKYKLVKSLNYVIIFISWFVCENEHIQRISTLRTNLHSIVSWLALGSGHFTSMGKVFVYFGQKTSWPLEPLWA